MTEAEYVSTAAGAQEAIWVGRLVAESMMEEPTEMVKPPELRIDSEGARKFASNPIYHERTKHIERRHYFIRDRVKRGDIELSWVPGKENWADMITKRLGRAELGIQKRRIGLMDRKE